LLCNNTEDLELWGWDRQVVPKCWYEITTTCCAITQNSAVLSYFVAEAWNQAMLFLLMNLRPSC